MHQPWGGASGQAIDIDIRAKEIVRLKQMIIQYFAEKTGKSEETIAHDLERDYFLSATEAVEYGVVDNVLARDSNVKEHKEQ
jgi:ATP-dependent Clp protease protease subunit